MNILKVVLIILLCLVIGFSCSNKNGNNQSFQIKVKNQTDDNKNIEEIKNIDQQTTVVNQNQIDKNDSQTILAMGQILYNYGITRNDFGIKLFHHLYQKTENIFVSPLSISLALMMTYNGAKSSTQKAIADVLSIDHSVSFEKIDQAWSVVCKSLSSSEPELILSIANSLWAQKGINFLPDFIQRNKQYFNSEVYTEDLLNTESVKKINDWVSINTKEKIKQVVSPPLNGIVLILINAIYFKGKWEEPFEKNQTKDVPFYLADGIQKRVKMMSKFDDFGYLENNEFQAVKLPYGKGRFSMYIFLPNKNSSLDNFIKNLDSQKINIWLGQFNKHKGNVKIPRFKMEYNTKLKDVLSALGMEQAFSSNADFSGMADRPVFINEVIHKTYIEVNEEGTEAAAVTSVLMMAGAAPQTPFNFTADRPFFFIIRDNESGIVIFMGTVASPQ